MIRRFFSGSVTPGECGEEPLAPRRRPRDRMPSGSRNVPRTCSRLAGAQQAVVHEDAGEPLADGPVQQHRAHRGVHAAATRRRARGRLPTRARERGDGLARRTSRMVQSARHAGNAEEEVLQDLLAPCGVWIDLRVELHAVERARRLRERGERARFAARGDAHRTGGQPRRTGRRGSSRRAAAAGDRGRARKSPFTRMVAGPYSPEVRRGAPRPPSAWARAACRSRFPAPGRRARGDPRRDAGRPSRRRCAGPPERMTAGTPSARRRSAGTSGGKISQ